MPTWRPAYLFDAHLEGAYLRGAHLKEAVANDATSWPINFDWQAAGVTFVPRPLH